MSSINPYLYCPFEVKADEITDKGIFSGYGSTFGGRPDSYGDIIVEGAFKETLAKNGRNGQGFAMLWQHRSEEPIGVWEEINENKTGLIVKGQLALEVQQGKETFILLKMRALKGLSIGWDLLRDEEGKAYEDSYERVEKNRRSVRYLKRIELWEISPVTFAANTSATVTTVKAVIEEAKNIRDFENSLREEGLSSSAAKYLAGLCKPELEKNWNKKSYELLKTIQDIRKKL